jgi:hypothetical protein
LSRKNKIILAIVIVLTLLSIGSCVAGLFILGSAGKMLKNSAVTDPTQVAEISSGVGDFKVPPGYHLGGFNFMGIYKGIMMSSDSDATQSIIMMQMPVFAETDQKQFEQQLQRTMDEQAQGQGITWQVTGTIPTTLRGQGVTLTLREGSRQDGIKVKSLSGLFQGRNGPVIMIISSTQSAWDQGTIDRFLHSIQ